MLLIVNSELSSESLFREAVWSRRPPPTDNHALSLAFSTSPFKGILAKVTEGIERKKE